MFDQDKAKLMLNVYQQQQQQILRIIDLDARRTAFEKNSTHPGIVAQFARAFGEALGPLHAGLNAETQRVFFDSTVSNAFTAEGAATALPA